MADTLHYLASETQTICGDSRLGLTCTKDVAKVLKCKNPEEHTHNTGIAAEGACQACANALAVTTFKRAKAQADAPKVHAKKPPVTE